MMDVLLKGLWLTEDRVTIRRDVRLRGARIHEIGESLLPHAAETIIEFENHNVYPGLINAHDHLEMNLYPRLGHPPYTNYQQWGHDIYKPKESPIREIEKVNIEDRLLWGGLKNLIAGATTVAHHNPWKKILSSKTFPVRVMDHLGWSHSLAFGKNIHKDYLRRPGSPFVIHAAEGVDAFAFREIEILNDLDVLHANTVLIHAIALSQKDIDLLVARKCAVVWCPSSNAFLFNRTADISALKDSIPVALGSDSSLTGSPTLLEEIQCARNTGLASAREIFNMVTASAARIFQVPDPRIQPGAVADLVITPKLHGDYYENLTRLLPENLEIVLVDGKPRYGNEKILEPFGLPFSFCVNGVKKKSVMDVPSLMKIIQRKVGTGILESNSLWKMLSA